MKSQHIFTLLLVTLSFSAVQASSKNFLDVKDYLKQISQKNTAFLSSEYLIKSYSQRSGEASLEFLPAFVSNISYTDNSLTPTLFVNPTQTITYGGYLGMQTKLRSGTSLGLTYNANYTIQSGGAYSPANGYWYNYPTLTLSQPLWKDFWASYSKANEDAQLANFKAQALGQRYTQQQISFNAEITYWRLSLFREIIKFDQQSLERTEKILKWNQRRVKMNVADRADLLQSLAALKQKQLQYQGDLEALRQVSSDFNKLRDIYGDTVSEELRPIDEALEAKLMKELKRTGERLDVLALHQTNEALQAQANSNMEKVKPDISLYGTAQLSGKNNEFSQAQTDSFKSTSPYYQVGLKMSVPLDFGLISEINQGNRSAKIAAQYSSQKAKSDLDQDWNDLQKKFKDVLVRFEMAKDLEALQKEKLDHERKRFNTGRTTSFQVLQFEDHYSESQLNRLRIENDAILLRAQARLYNGENL